MPQFTNIHVFTSQWPEHELLDSGNYQKLERFGPHRLIRPEPKAWWKPELPEHEWRQAVARYDERKDKWRIVKSTPTEWEMRYGHFIFAAKMTDMSKHVGIFPEQSSQWDWLQALQPKLKRTKPALLNLFGYTAIASLAAASVGFQVTHVDASKPALAWAKRNQQLSNLTDKPIRWLLDDAIKFVKREGRRKQKYDAIILDPPSFGKGPKHEIWKIEKHLYELLSACREILSDQPLFIILNLYAIEASSLMIGNLLQDMMNRYSGTIDLGELALNQTGSQKILPLSIFGRWQADSLK